MHYGLTIKSTKMKKLIAIVIFTSIFGLSYSQNYVYSSSPEYVKNLTSSWKGERSPDGRPKVSETDLKRIEDCTLEQIWSFLNSKGYRNQIEYDWIILKPGETMVGRIVTAQFVPHRPDLDTLVIQAGIREGHSQVGGRNQWPIAVLTKDDIYVADGFGKINNGTLIGSSLGNSITGKTGKGVVFYGSIRDMQELKETEGFNAWIKGHHPSAIRDMVPSSLNSPIRIGEATVFPGDILFANDYGVVFIPPFLVDELLSRSALEAARDTFEREMLQGGKYPSGEIHGRWSENMKKVYRDWFIASPNKFYLTIQQIDEYIKSLPK